MWSGPTDTSFESESNDTSSGADTLEMRVARNSTDRDDLFTTI